MTNSIRIHLTNVSGLGASNLVLSLLPELERNNKAKITKVYLPDRGKLSTYIGFSSSVEYLTYRRILPKSISRLVECLLSAKYFDDPVPMLVLGDLPIRTTSPQILFVQTSNILRQPNVSISFEQAIFFISRWIFNRNQKYVKAYIVQTEVMKSELLISYPELAGRVHVVPQPVPDWLLTSGLKRNHRYGKRKSRDKGLKLFYPAAGYPHKNHTLLSHIRNEDNWWVEELILTVDIQYNPCPELSWVSCVGVVDSIGMIAFYAEADALLFLSKKESFGFPLIESMYVGLPIICPDLPYARILCGEQAIYFNPDSISSLQCAIDKLAKRLDRGWWPDWSERLRLLPRTWEEVADRMVDIVLQ